MRPYLGDEEYELSYWTHESRFAGPTSPSDCSSTLAMFGGSGLPDFFASLAKGKAPALQQVNDFAARTTQNGVETSALRRFSNSGAITRMNIKPGRNQVETLAYLPKTAKDVTVSLLDPFGESDPLKLLMINDPKESYQYGHPDSLALPKVIERQRGSIANHEVASRGIRSQSHLKITDSSDMRSNTGAILDDMWSLQPGGLSKNRKRKGAFLDADLDIDIPEFDGTFGSRS